MAKGFDDGSVYQTKDGRWRGKVRLTDPVSKKKQPVKYFYGKSETDVKRRIQQTTEKRNSRNPRASKRQTAERLQITRG